MPFLRPIQSDNLCILFKRSRLYQKGRFHCHLFSFFIARACVRICEPKVINNPYPFVSISDLRQTIYFEKGENLCQVIKWHGRQVGSSSSRKYCSALAQFISSSTDIILILTTFFNSLWIHCRKWSMHEHPTCTVQCTHVFIALIVTLFTILFLYVSQAPKSFDATSLHSLSFIRPTYYFFGCIISLSMRVHTHIRSLRRYRQRHIKLSDDSTWGIWCHCKSATSQQMKRRKNGDVVFVSYTKFHRWQRTNDEFDGFMCRWRCRNRKSAWSNGMGAVVVFAFFGANSSLYNNRHPQLLRNDLSESLACVFFLCI